MHATPIPNPAPTVPPELVYQLLAAKDAAYQTALQNERLHQQLKEKALREDAYTVAFNANQCTWAVSESGRLIELMDCCVEESIHLVFYGPMPHPDLYLLRFSGRDFSIQMDEAVYLDDKRFINTLQNAGIRVRIRRSTRTTAALIRQCVSALLRSVATHYYEGWAMQGEAPVFSAFTSFSSHQGTGFLSIAHSVQRLPEAAEALAVEHFSAIFRAIRSSALRWLVTVWYHAAFLFSLLEHGNASLPLGLCLFTEAPLIQLWLRHLLNWYGDNPINLDDHPSDVSCALWQRKDQPVLLVDFHQTANAAKNAGLIEGTLASGKVFLRDGQKNKTVPLQGAVTLITNAISALICSPSLLVVEVDKEDLDLEACQKYCEKFPSNEDYLRTFASYTATHWSELKNALRKGQAQAFSQLPDGSQNSLAALGTLLGVADFLKQFFRAHKVKEAPISSAQDGLPREIAALFQQPSLSGADTAFQFCYIARTCLEHTILAVCEDGRDCSETETPVVYIAGEDYGFSREAFRDVCRRMGQSSPTVAKALAEAGLLRGKSTNSTTFQTRIPVYNVYGVMQWIGVYRIAQEDILTSAF